VSDRIDPSPDRTTRISDSDRERVAQILYRAAGENRLTLDELRERIDGVYAAKTAADLDPVLRDLPVSRSELVPIDAANVPADPRVGGRPGSRLSLGILSFAQRRGGWVVPRQHFSAAVWGRAEIDLREARFAEQECVINTIALLGGIEIIVPDDITVSVGGFGLLGRFGGTESYGPPGAPVVRIRGVAIWGAVVVTRRPAGAETAQPEK
jgi:hypothetical protein